VFFVVTKLTRAVPPLAVFLIAAALEAAPIETGWTVIDEFASRFVYFYTGYWLAAHIFSFADEMRKYPLHAAGGLLLWAVVNGLLVSRGYAEWPLVSLVLGFLGACAIVTGAALLAKIRVFEALRYCGEHSLVIYLAFFLPMALSRMLFLRTGMITDLGTVSLLVTAIGIVGALAIWWAARNTALRFLFDRPAAFWLTPKPRVALQAAE